MYFFKHRTYTNLTINYSLCLGAVWRFSRKTRIFLSEPASSHKCPTTLHSAYCPAPSESGTQSCSKQSTKAWISLVCVSPGSESICSSGFSLHNKMLLVTPNSPTRILGFAFCRVYQSIPYCYRTFTQISENTKINSNHSISNFHFSKSPKINYNSLSPIG